MCELSQFSYAEGSVVWVKLGSCWWPGEVKNVDNLPEEILQNLKKKPFTAVKFFDEDKYEYVRNLNNICLYNNRRKNEFIRKGLDMARAKAKEGSSLMKKFPNDVVTAESLTGGDPNILAKDAFAPQERPNYREIFGETPGKKKSSRKNNSPNKSSSERKPGRPPSNGQSKSWKELEMPSPVRVVPKITHRRFISESDHEVRIRQQPSTPTKEDVASPVNNYKCHLCNFTSSRLNVIVLHNKAQHSESAIAAAKLQTSSTGKKRRTSVGKTPTSSTTSKQKGRNEGISSNMSRAKRNILSESEKKVGNMESFGEKSSSSVRKKGKASSKKRRETEVRESLLADWDEEDKEEEEKEIENLKLVLGSSRKLEEDNLNETNEDIIPLEKDLNTEQSNTSAIQTSPEKTPEKLAESCDLEQEFKSLMNETTVPEMPKVPVINANLPINEIKLDEEVSEGDKNESKDRNEGGEAKEGLNQDEQCIQSNEMKVNSPLCGKIDANGCKEEDKPSEPGLTLNNSPIQESDKSQIPITKDEIMPPNTSNNQQIIPAVQTPVNASPQANSVNQETFGILPITSDSQKTNLAENMTVTLPATSIVEGLPTRTLVSAASSEETTETATYVLVTIDDSGALQPIDNMNTVVNTALLALDGQQDDGPRTLYIDPSQLGTQGTDLENIFLAIDTRGDMATQMVELANRGNDQSEITGQTFSAAAASSAAKAKSAQDILAVALANTQVFQGDGSYVTLNPAASAVTVTSSRSAQAPVMTPRVIDPCRSNVANAVPPISHSPSISELPGHIGEVQRPVNLPTPTLEAPPFHPQLQPPQNIAPLSLMHPPMQTPSTLTHMDSGGTTNHLDTSTVSTILTLPSLIPTTYTPSVGMGNGQTGSTALTLISGANLIMDQVAQALPKVDSEGILETSRDHVAEKRKLDCDLSDVRESKQMREVDENGGGS